MSTREGANDDGAPAKRYRFGSQFEAIVNAAKPRRRWYQMDLRSKLNAKTGYVTFAFGAFAIMFIFGALSIHVDDDCLIQNASGRCCSCVEIANATERLNGQVMPMKTSYNDVYYGVLMMINSLFGILYLYTGLTQENKYLLFCMVATQTLECSRGLIDVFLDKGGTLLFERQALMYLTIAFMVVGWIFLRPVYRMFGWKIFRQGGAKKTIRNMYKMYQRYRAANFLDIQSSFLIFIIFFFYLDVVRWHGYWVFICFFLCDISASRFMLKYLKREDMKGVIISVVAKLFVITWWVLVIYYYLSCFNRYRESRELTASWWELGYVPELMSVYESYNGLSCLAPGTVHDDRTLEVLAINFGQALLFRFGSLVITVFVCRDFGKGLRDVFYPGEASPSGGHDESLMQMNDEGSINHRNGDRSEDDRRYGEYSDEEFDPDKYNARHPQAYEDDD